MAFMAGCIVSLAMVAALGAIPGSASAPAAPRYAVQVVGVITYITDNQTNSLYTYENQNDASVLRSVLDLNDVGKPKLKAKVVKPPVEQE